MKHSIIVIDDDIGARENLYKEFAIKLSHIHPSFEVILDFVKHPSETRLKVRNNRYSAAIVDAVLDGNWKSYSITDAIRDLGREIPIAVISSQWDNTNSPQIDEAWKHPRCRTFLHWRDIDPKLNGQVDYAIRSMISLIADNEALDMSLEMEPDRSIFILHLSDVQTGGFDDKSLKLQANCCADRILEHCQGSSPQFVAFTGDVTEYGDPQQYASARDWIQYFCAQIGIGNIPTSKLLYVPGNHDVNLNLAAATRIRTKTTDGRLELELSNEISQNGLIGYAYTPFRNFLSEITDCPLLSDGVDDQSLAWVEGRYRYLGVVFYGINTAQPASAFGVPNRQVDPNALALIGNKLKELKGNSVNDRPLIIGLGHHCPVSASGDTAVENPEEFRRFFVEGGKTALFLHGHTHQHEFEFSSNSKFKLVRSCAGTLTKLENSRPSDSLRGFNLLELKRENHSVRSVRGYSYAWIGDVVQKIKEDEWIRDDDVMLIPPAKKRRRTK